MLARLAELVVTQASAPGLPSYDHLERWMQSGPLGVALIFLALLIAAVVPLALWIRRLTNTIISLATQTHRVILRDPIDDEEDGPDAE